MPELKLPRLPDRTPVKLTIGVSPELHRALGDYAELYRAAYGEQVAIPDLVPAMVERFLESDRNFARLRRQAGGA